MKNKFCIVILVLLLVSVFYPVAADGPKADRWEPDIKKFLEWDSKNSFPDDAVLFVGSSSVRIWKTNEAFPEYKVINRGFGGSQVSDLLNYYDKIVLKYKPSVIVLYSGDNDTAVGKSSEIIISDYQTFIDRTHEKLPGTPIVILSIKPSGARWNLWPRMEKTNSMLSILAGKYKQVYYLDLAGCLLDKDGMPEKDYFLGDNLHMNEKGYHTWNTRLGKVLDGILKQAGTTENLNG